MCKKIHDFKLGKIANDFRFLFTHRLSEKALEHSWRSSISVQTNEAQNDVYFKQDIQFDTDRIIESVYRDIQDVLKSLKNEEWIFDAKCIKKAKEYEFTNISRLE